MSNEEFNKDKSKDKVITKKDLQIFKKDIETRLTTLENKIDKGYKTNEDLDQLVNFMLERIDAMGDMMQDDFQRKLNARIEQRRQDHCSDKDFLINKVNGLFAVGISISALSLAYLVVYLITIFLIT